MLLVSTLFERSVRAISVQLATAADAPGVALAATGAARLFRLDVRVDRARDQLIGTASPVLVNDRGPFAVVPHPGHQVAQPGAADRGKVIPGVAKIVKVQAFGADRADRVRPGGHLVEVAPPKRPALDAGEQQGARGRGNVYGEGSCSSGMIAAGMPTTRRPARDFGAPSTSSPVERSTNAARTLTAPTLRSISHRRSAVASPHRKLANVASSTRAR